MGYNNNTTQTLKYVLKTEKLFTQKYLLERGKRDIRDYQRGASVILEIIREGEA